VISWKCKKPKATHEKDDRTSGRDVLFILLLLSSILSTRMEILSTVGFCVGRSDELKCLSGLFFEAPRVSLFLWYKNP